MTVAELLGPAEIRRLMPRDLPPAERAVWREYADVLGRRGLTEAEIPWLRLLCHVTAERISEMRALLRARPDQVAHCQNRLLTLIRWELRLLREGGMTPATRRRVEELAPSAASLEAILLADEPARASRRG